ncbi:MAG: hypothetical protein WC989_06295 [Micavibrio sp.]
MQFTCHFSPFRHSRSRPRVRGHGQSGGVLVWILIAVALFAALSYAMMRDGGTGTAARTMTDAQARLLASEIISYGNAVRQAVQKLEIRGCTDLQISFENSVVAGYENGTDTICQVFHPAGGGLGWKAAPEDALDPQYESSELFGQYVYNGMNCVMYVGKAASYTDNGGCGTPRHPELLVMLPFIKKEVKEAINALLGIESELFDYNSVYIGGKFQGAYLSYPTAGFDQNPDFAGKRTGAATMGNSGNPGLPTHAPASSHIFYQVLIAR